MSPLRGHAVAFSSADQRRAGKRVGKGIRKDASLDGKVPIRGAAVAVGLDLFSSELESGIVSLYKNSRTVRIYFGVWTGDIYLTRLFVRQTAKSNKAAGKHKTTAVHRDGTDTL